MPIVQVEMNVLAERADRADEIDHVPPGVVHRILDVCDQVRQPASSGVSLPRLRPGWQRLNLADACLMPTWPMSMQQLTCSASRSRSATPTYHSGSEPAAYSRKTR